MANTRTMYFGSELSETNTHHIEAFANTNNEIYFCIKKDGLDSVIEPNFIVLDAKTAIKLVKDLKREIGFINQNKS